MKKILILAPFLVIGILVLVFFTQTQNNNNPIKTSNTDSSQYPLLAQRIFIENPTDVKINFSGLRSDLRKYFEENSLEGGLYFEYLPTGSSIRINANEEFRAASLMKIPVAMEVYKAAELGLLNLDEEIILKEEWLNSDFGDLYEKGAGYQLTLEEVIEILLTKSDNTALRAAIAATDGVLPIEERALGSLDVEFSVDQSGSIDIGARSYASFFKCLYFACYNSVEHSNTLLKYLTQSNFNDRIVSGVPDTVLVAHKIGVFNTTVQSDCGIIYKENRNYILCIMLSAQDTPETKNHFYNLSIFAYDFLNN
jgi:beta-lactamase class A